jgi:HEAT repeat protein
MSSARLPGRELKRILGAELSNDPFAAALERIGRIPPKQAVSPLFGFFCSRDQLVRWHAVTAMGMVTARLAEENPESARVVLRRCIWNLNEESGGIGWEAIGESLARSAALAREYGCILLSYLDPQGNFIDHPALQEGVLWGVGRMTRTRPENAAECVRLLKPFLSDPAAVLRGLAAWAVGSTADEALTAALEMMADDDAPFTLYEDERLVRTTVGAVARRVIRER